MIFKGMKQISISDIFVCAINRNDEKKDNWKKKNWKKQLTDFLNLLNNIGFHLIPRDRGKHLGHHLLFSIIKIGKAHQCPKHAVFRVLFLIKAKYLA